MTKKIISIGVLCIFLLTSLTVASVVASNDDELDQYQTQSDGGAVVGFHPDLGVNSYLAQSFIPQKGILTRIELYIAKGPTTSKPYTAAIRKELTGENIAVKSVSSEIITEAPLSWVEFDFDDITVNTGQTYYIVSYTNNVTDNYYGWGYSESDVYPNGEVFASINDGETWEVIEIYDMCFKTYGKEDTEEPDDEEPPEGPKPKLEIEPFSDGLGINIAIKNIGDKVAEEVEWSVTIEGGLKAEPREASGIIKMLAPEETEKINIPIKGIGLGILSDSIKITITATAPDANTVKRTENMNLLGSRIFHLSTRKRTIEDVGTVKYIPTKDGFFGIINGHGTYFKGKIYKDYLPINLPLSFGEDGLRVRFTAKIMHRLFLDRNLGALRIKIIDIELFDEEQIPDDEEPDDDDQDDEEPDDEEPDTTPPKSWKTIGDPKWPKEEKIETRTEEIIWVTTKTPITLEATDKNEDGFGSWRIYWEIDDMQGLVVDSGIGDWDTPVTIYFPQEGEFTLMWLAEDDSHNFEELHIQTHKVDDTPPITTIVTLPYTKPYKPSEGPYNVIEYPPIYGTVKISLTAQDEGVKHYYIHYRTRDKTGWSEWKTGEIDQPVNLVLDLSGIPIYNQKPNELSAANDNAIIQYYSEDVLENKESIKSWATPYFPDDRIRYTS